MSYAIFNPTRNKFVEIRPEMAPIRSHEYDGSHWLYEWPGKTYKQQDVFQADDDNDADNTETDLPCTTQFVPSKPKLFYSHAPVQFFDAPSVANALARSAYGCDITTLGFELRHVRF